ncbi:MAG: hypothetical protein HY764_01665 [Candidatus Portnoybacteria bacterium]|nr:hypothetical protein [Candidatus Portnoybacteria bacterium]
MNHERNLRLRVQKGALLVSQAIILLSEGESSVRKILVELSNQREYSLLKLLDQKHLYGTEIVKVFYAICGADMKRFIYHLIYELPCQICDEFSFLWPPSGMNAEEIYLHCKARQFCKNSPYWGLPDYPKRPDYDYPIKTFIIGCQIKK